jgi:putative flippase GtrA
MRLTPSSKARVQLVRSLVVSTIAFAVDFGLLVFLREVAGLHYLLAATVSYCVGLLVNYVLSVKWVFADRKLSNRRTEFVIFAVISMIGLILNNLVLSGLVQLIGLDYRLAKIAATIVVFFWNFLVRKKILY